MQDDDDDEFEHLQDDEEFEGFDKAERTGKSKGPEKPVDLKIQKVYLIQIHVLEFIDVDFNHVYFCDFYLLVWFDSDISFHERMAFLLPATHLYFTAKVQIYKFSENASMKYILTLTSLKLMHYDATLYIVMANTTFNLYVYFQIPLHLRTNWDSFYMEMLMLAGLLVYFLNFLAGKTKNGKLAQAWYNAHRELLESQFAIVGE